VSSTDLTLRAAGEADADAVAEVFSSARRAAVPAIPPAVHAPDEVRTWMARRLAGGHEVWVAEERGVVVGFADVDGAWLDALYVRPAHTGRGVGSALLDTVKALRPEGFGLWVFETNEPARRFYARHGLVELEHTDGSENEERAPDLRMVWPGRDPLRCLRALMDEVDDELARVVARRVALTRAIQGFKPVAGLAGRDADREAEIARRMAARAPGPGEAFWRRLVHEVISLSLEEEPGPHRSQ
jgi:GNAT superfamily N-acetyltransferase/chorismate mutase